MCVIHYINVKSAMKFRNIFINLVDVVLILNSFPVIDCEGMKILINFIKNYIMKFFPKIIPNFYVNIMNFNKFSEIQLSFMQFYSFFEDI
jgi:hemerythrin-like domain-containing protein